MTQAYGWVWVAGEIGRLTESQRGHLYFELVEKGVGDRIVGKLDAVVWRTPLARIRRQLRAQGQKLSSGQHIRCRGRLDFYPPGGRLQFVVDEVDPLFTLGLLERRRRETMAALEAAGLLEKNAGLPLPELPLRLGLVTSEESAAFHDFLAGLDESGYGFQVFFVHASMQGEVAEQEVSRAIRALAHHEIDAVALIRGGGARSDLAAFDSRRIAEAVAHCRWPVVTGLGHEIDRSIADVVSHTALKTPSKVAEFFVERVRACELAVTGAEEALVRRSRDRLARAGEALYRYERLAQTAALRIRGAQRSLEQSSETLRRLATRRLQEAERRRAELAERLAAAAPRALERRRRQPAEVGRRVVAAAVAKLRQTSTRVEGLARLGQALAPERLLERGFSITRDARGAIVKDPSRLEPGDRITSQLAGGSVASRVEEK